MESHRHSPPGSRWERVEPGDGCTRTVFGIRVSRLALGGFIAAAAFFLITEHAAHLYGVLPLLFVLACPLMHLFHHHGGHHARDGQHHDSEAAGHVEGLRPEDFPGSRT